ncbi:hypothetical protein ACVMII_003891 [Bradyrhizobium diazoefficiens]
MRELRIDLYGHPGSGKTLLLAAIYMHSHTHTASAAVLDQVRRISERLPLEVTGSGRTEEVTITSDDTKLQFVSHPGESMLKDGALNAAPLIAELQSSKSRVFVGVLNPFLSNKELAWKAVRMMIAILQSGLSIDFETAVHIAFESLFHVDRPLKGGAVISEPVTASPPPVEAPPLSTEVSKSERPVTAAGSGSKVARPRFSSGLAALITGRAKDIVLKYDYLNPIFEDRFEWQNVPSEVIGHTQGELQRAVEHEVLGTKSYRDTLRQVFEAVDNSMLVLTHLDLTSFMPGIDSLDFDPVWDELFNGRADRKVSQQLLAAMLKSEVTRNGIVPWDVQSEFPKRFIGYIQSLSKGSIVAPIALKKATKLLVGSIAVAGLFGILCLVLTNSAPGFVVPFLGFLIVIGLVWFSLRAMQPQSAKIPWYLGGDLG